MKSKSTNKDLVEMLEALKDPARYGELIDQARNNRFHDFKSTETCGKVALVDELSKFPELTYIRNQVIDGVFDESPDEDDKAELRKDLPDHLHSILEL